LVETSTSRQQKFYSLLILFPTESPLGETFSQQSFSGGNFNEFSRILRELSFIFLRDHWHFNSIVHAYSRVSGIDLAECTRVRIRKYMFKSWAIIWCCRVWTRRDRQNKATRRFQSWTCHRVRDFIFGRDPRIYRYARTQALRKE